MCCSWCCHCWPKVTTLTVITIWQCHAGEADVHRPPEGHHLPRLQRHSPLDRQPSGHRMKGIVIVNFEPEAFIYTEVVNSTKTAVCFREKKMLLFRTRAAGVKLAGLLHATLLETGFPLQPLRFNCFFFSMPTLSFYCSHQDPVLLRSSWSTPSTTLPTDWEWLLRWGRK